MVKKAETIEEYLARGGKVTNVPAAERPEPVHILPAKTAVDYDTMSLGEGEFLFGETRVRKSKTPKKKVTGEDFTKMIESSGLPASVMEALKNSVRK